jgi:hypothetical protein
LIPSAVQHSGAGHHSAFDFPYRLDFLIFNLDIRRPSRVPKLPMTPSTLISCVLGKLSTALRASSCVAPIALSGFALPHLPLSLSPISIGQLWIERRLSIGLDAAPEAAKIVLDMRFGAATDFFAEIGVAPPSGASGNRRARLSRHHFSPSTPGQCRLNRGLRDLPGPPVNRNA